MQHEVRDFYDTLAGRYRLIFDDWDVSIQRQANILGPLIESRLAKRALRILDCACGIGTQALGLAARGHLVTASDISFAELEQARSEARKRGLPIDCYTSDMTSLAEIPGGKFDAVIAMDNALPHLDFDQLAVGAEAIASKLRPGGLFMASIRDYDQLLVEKPAILPPAFYGPAGARRIVHQIWDWMSEDSYRMHLYISTESAPQWQTSHQTCLYHAIRRDALSGVLTQAGFRDLQWLHPPQSGFYQPIVLATLADESSLPPC